MDAHKQTIVLNPFLFCLMICYLTITGFENENGHNIVWQRQTEWISILECSAHLIRQCLENCVNNPVLVASGSSLEG